MYPDYEIYIFLIFQRKHTLWVLINRRCGYSLEMPHRGTSNEYPQHMFSMKNKKNVNFRASKSWLEKWILIIYLSVDKKYIFDNSTNLSGAIVCWMVTSSCRKILVWLFRLFILSPPLYNQINNPEMKNIIISIKVVILDFCHNDVNTVTVMQARLNSVKP